MKLNDSTEALDLPSGLEKSLPSSLEQKRTPVSSPPSNHPITESQREIWNSVQLDCTASLAFNESISLRFIGPLNADVLNRALQQVILRHESLRMSFHENGQDFSVAAESLTEIKNHDYSALPSLEKKDKIQELLRQEVSTPFDLKNGPLLRAHLIQAETQEYFLILTCHHIICDGWSYSVILHELACCYNAVLQGIPPELEPAPSFSAFARNCASQHETQKYQQNETYWLNRFSVPIVPLDLPIDRTRPTFKTYSSLRKDYQLGPELIQAVRKTGGKHGCTLMHTLLASLQVLLYRLTFQEQIIVGIPAAGQLSAGLSSLVGHCLSTLPLLSVLDGNQEFSEFLRTVKKAMLDAYDHQEFTYGTLLEKLKPERDPSRSTLIPILFNLEQKLKGNQLGFAPLQVEFSSNPRLFENFELFMNAVEDSGQVTLEVQYNTDLFDESTIDRWMASYQTLLQSIVVNPKERVSSLQLLPVAEQQKIIIDWNNSLTEYPRSLTVHELIQLQAQRTPHGVAAQFENQNLTYQELNERSNQLAHRLSSLGVTKNTLVGVLLDRSLDMLIAMLGVLKAGGGYVPLDPSLPRDRIRYMLAHSKISVLITYTQRLKPGVLADRLCNQDCSPRFGSKVPRSGKCLGTASGL